MALMWRVIARWTGGQIGTGFTNLFFTEGTSTAQLAADSVKTFFSSGTTAGANLAPGITISFPSLVDVMDPETGTLITSVPITAPSPLTSSGSGTYSAPTGSCVTWVTSGVVAGHRVFGRTFIVPLAMSAFQADGTLSAVHISDLSAAAIAFIAAAPELVVWHRPGPALTGGGSTHPVLAARIVDKAAVLTSRR